MPPSIYLLNLDRTVVIERFVDTEEGQQRIDNHGGMAMGRTDIWDVIRMGSIRQRDATAQCLHGRRCSASRRRPRCDAATVLVVD